MFCCSDFERLKPSLPLEIQACLHSSTNFLSWLESRKSSHRAHTRSRRFKMFFYRNSPIPIAVGAAILLVVWSERPISTSNFVFSQLRSLRLGLSALLADSYLYNGNNRMQHLLYREPYELQAHFSSDAMPVT